MSAFMFEQRTRLEKSGSVGEVVLRSHKVRVRTDMSHIRHPQVFSYENTAPPKGLVLAIGPINVETCGHCSS